ncbi:MAG: MarR family EPS-associated transcriptional regulator [Sulfurospirillum sp.]|nr:MarR family EPS-associated transcriptional regulator [Sulfurospirillum sp.]MBL0702665.1 MarR family EPS-associated transcriptional regulator [Sulfurospirillum sp.]
MQRDYQELLILRNINQNTSQPRLAKEVGFSVGKVNFIIKALVDKGLLKCDRFISSNNKMKYSYLLTDDGIREKMVLTKKFIDRKKTEYEELQREYEIDVAKWGKTK